MLGMTGFRLIQAPTFIPAYIEAMSGSVLAVGLARGAQSLGQSLSPIISATLIEHRRKVLPLGFLVGGAMRLQVLGISLAGFFLGAGWNLLAVCTFLALFGVFMGMQGVIFNFLMGKVIPMERRGVLSGLRNALAGVTAASVAWLGGRYFVDTNALGNGYATTFLVAFGLTSLGLTMLLFTREPESPRVLERSNVRARIGDMLPLLRSDRNFSAYFQARALASMARMGIPFYFLYAKQDLPISGAQLGLLTAGFVLGQTVLNLFWGLMADRTGFRRVFQLAMLVWLGSALLLLQAESFGTLLVVFTALGAGTGGWMMAAQTLVLEFGKREDLPLRIAIANSGSEFMAAIGAVLGGLIVVSYSFEPVFWLAIGFKLAAIAVMALRVEEPRGLKRA